nr:probable ATP-dependent DNA helicase HFM1 [Dermacentor andersoni]
MSIGGEPGSASRAVAYSLLHRAQYDACGTAVIMTKSSLKCDTCPSTPEKAVHVINLPHTPNRIAYQQVERIGKVNRVCVRSCTRQIFPTHDIERHRAYGSASAQRQVHAAAALSQAAYEAPRQGAVLESSLLRAGLAEHLNAELVLGSLPRPDLSGCLAWARETFLHVRLLENPEHYGFPPGLSRSGAEEALHGLCREAIEALSAAGLVNIDRDTGCLQPNGAGCLMARQCISLDTMRCFSELGGKLSIADLLWSLSCCSEFADVQLRNNEKAALNALNGSRRKPGIRFPMTGRIKTTEMKVNWWVCGK